MQDEQRISKLLQTDPKRHFFEREDEHHFINARNVFGQTPLYVACKHGNLNIVKILIDEGCNLTTRSTIDKLSTESNL